MKKLLIIIVLLFGASKINAQTFDFLNIDPVYVGDTVVLKLRPLYSVVDGIKYRKDRYIIVPSMTEKNVIVQMKLYDYFNQETNVNERYVTLTNSQFRQIQNFLKARENFSNRKKLNARRAIR